MALVANSDERQQYRYYFRLDQTCVYIHNQQQYNDKVLLKYAMEYLSCEVSVVVFIIFCISCNKGNTRRFIKVLIKRIHLKHLLSRPNINHEYK